MQDEEAPVNPFPDAQSRSHYQRDRKGHKKCNVSPLLKDGNRWFSQYRRHLRFALSAIGEPCSTPPFAANSLTAGDYP